MVQTTQRGSETSNVIRNRAVPDGLIDQAVAVDAAVQNAGVPVVVACVATYSPASASQPVTQCSCHVRTYVPSGRNWSWR